MQCSNKKRKFFSTKKEIFFNKKRNFFQQKTKLFFNKKRNFFSTKKNCCIQIDSFLMENHRKFSYFIFPTLSIPLPTGFLYKACGKPLQKFKTKFLFNRLKKNADPISRPAPLYAFNRFAWENHHFEFLPIHIDKDTSEVHIQIFYLSGGRSDGRKGKGLQSLPSARPR